MPRLGRVKGYPSLVSRRGVVGALVIIVCAVSAWGWLEWKALSDEARNESLSWPDDYPVLLESMQHRAIKVWQMVISEVVEPEPAIPSFEPATEEMALSALEEAEPLMDAVTGDEIYVDAALKTEIRALEGTWEHANQDLATGNWSAANGRLWEIANKTPGILAESKLIKSVAIRGSRVRAIKSSAEESDSFDPQQQSWQDGLDANEAAQTAIRARKFEEALDLLSRAAASFLSVGQTADDRRSFEQAQAELTAALRNVDSGQLKKHGGETWKQILIHVRTGRNCGEDYGKGMEAYQEALALLPTAVREAEQNANDAAQSSQFTQAEALIEEGEAASAVEILSSILRQADADAQRAFQLLEKTLLTMQADGQPMEVALRLSEREELALVYLPPGTFRMGSNQHQPEEKPVRDVSIEKGFWIGRYELTKGQYDTIANPSRKVGVDEAVPITGVSWHKAQWFCRKLADAYGLVVRLPTEAEWEFACRAGTSSDYSFPQRAEAIGKFGNVKGSGKPGFESVGKYMPNPWGLYDMHGNVFEWVGDANPSWGHEQLAGDTQAHGKRIVRGGCWRFGADLARSSSRYPYLADFGSDYVGFRVVVQAE